MKNIIIILLLVVSVNLFGQETNGKHKYSKKLDIIVSYKDSLQESRSKYNPAYYVNDFLLEYSDELISINPRKVKSIDVEKKDFEINGKKYYGKIIIKTKDNYKPNFITLKELAYKYLTIDTSPLIFQIDDKIINYDINKYVVDEKFILKIELSKVKTSEQNIEINFIKIMTKTTDNKKKLRKIRIR